MSRIESVVCHSSGVSGASYFGSIARGGADSFSDIDLVVRCDHRSAYDIVSGLHAVLGVILYRPFSAGRRPSGRYWFRSAHPFLRLDVSFHEPQAFDTLLARGGEFARAPFLGLEISNEHREAVGIPLPSWPVEDEDFATALRLFQESAKALVRGESPKRPLDVVVRGVEGARSDNLRAATWALYERSWEHLRAAGLQGVVDVREGSE